MLRGKRDPGDCCTSPARRRGMARYIAAALCIAGAICAQSAQAQPANDECLTPTPLTTGVAATGTSAGATGTDLTSLCGTNDTSDVWFSWTADCTGNVTVSSCGSGFNTTLSAFIPPCNEFLFDIACADDECGTQSQLNFLATSGDTYFIRLAGVNGATGNYTVTVTCPEIGGCCIGGGFCEPDVTPDDCANVFFGLFLGDGTDCNGTECSFGACCAAGGCTDEMGFDACNNAGGIYQGDGTICATTTCPIFGACCGFFDGSCTDLTQANCDLAGGIYLGDNTDCLNDGLACATGACCSSSGGCTETDSLSCQATLGTFFGSGTTCTDFVCNDDCGSATVVNSVPYTNQIDNATAADGPANQYGSCDGAVGVVALDVWYRWTPSSDCDATVSWTPLAGQDNVLIVWQSLLAPPESECLSGAFASMAGVPGPNEVDCQECEDGTGGCPDPGVAETSTFFAQAGTTYWFQCGQQGAIPDAGGLSEFSVTCSFVTGGCCLDGACTEQFASQCDAMGGLYLGDGTDCLGGCPGGACCEPDGTCSNAATPGDCSLLGGTWQGDGVDCLDVVCGGACCVTGSCQDVVSEAACNTLAGTYLGNGTTCATSICNDDCANAIDVMTGVTYNGTNLGATGTNESSCAGTADTTDVWHTWLADCTDTVTVSLCGSNFDTSLAVFDGCGGLELACNDDTTACGSNNSQLTFPATAGTTYWIRVAGWNGATGNYVLNVTCPPIGACCSGGVCSDVSINTCGDLGGTFLGEGTDCLNDGDTCIIGACCYPNGTCDDGGNEADCLMMNGEYLGNATECSTSTCPPVGACCTEASPGVFTCTIGFESTCVANSGTYLGDGTDCTPVAGATSRCDCNDNGVLDTEDANGPQIRFDSNPGLAFSNTLPGLDAISIGDTSTIFDVNVEMDITHTWMGDVTLELEHNGTIVTLFAGSCGNVDNMSVTFDDEGSALVCAQPIVGVTIPAQALSAFDGMTADGFWNLSLVDCCNGDDGTLDHWAIVIATGPPTGSDCNGNSILDECETPDPTTQGACCFADDTCTTTDSANCTTLGGAYRGDCTNCIDDGCLPVGACCTAGVCTAEFAADCGAGGGNFLGAGTTCDAGSCDGACCSGGSCTIQPQADCLDAGEVFFGPGSACEDVVCPGPGFVPLNYNWNGMVHAIEPGDADRPNGYRTIADRGLFLDGADAVGGGTYGLASGNRLYAFEVRPDVVDMIMIGQRSAAFDTVDDADNLGLPPNWDPSAGTGNVLSSVTNLTPTAPLDDNFEIGVLYHATQGGGTFVMTLGFSDLTSVSLTLQAPDWFANNNGTPAAANPGVLSQALLPAPLSGGDGFDGSGNFDLADASAPLNIVEAVVSYESLLGGLGFDVAGKQLTTLTFNNFVGSTNACAGIFAASISQPGACCSAGGMCTDALRSDCTALGGTYLGDGTDCLTNGAACQIGACCFTDNTCDDGFSSIDCDNAGGFYLGEGSTCAMNSCPPTGACCTETSPGIFACTIDFGSTCTLGGGLYLGDGSNCDFGCDCNSNGVVDLTEIGPGNDCDDNGILDECETPDPSTVGACCVDQSCSLETSANCDAMGGTYFGDCSNCGQINCPAPGFVQLDYNWNGMVHAGEDGMPDSADGYRTFGDRGLIVGHAQSFGGTTSVLTRGNLTYQLETRPTPSLDIVHIGFRGAAWDLTVDGDNIGIAPSWDPSLLGDGKQVPTSTSTFAPSPALNSAFELGVLYNASEGGGQFNMTLGFTDTSSVTVRLHVPDWFANGNGTPNAPLAGVASQVLVPGPLSGGDGFRGAAGHDQGNLDQPLNVVEALVTANSLLTGQGFDVTGRQLESITFDNWAATNAGSALAAGVGIYAASYHAPTTGACTCPGDVNADTLLNGSDVQGFVNCLLGGPGDCSCADLDGMNGADMADVSMFVSNLLTGATCP